ncbi:hypothetical protein IWW50_002160 [Coemansia erecta]|nr:hypothetical protein IWW50_002160 [Coemansia erecta]
MRLRSKSAKIHNISEDDICIAPVWSDIPRNPVFYPPITRKDTPIDTTYDSAANTGSESKSGRLMTRLRAILLSKPAAAQNNRRTMDFSNFKPQWYSTPSEASKPTARPRLVARSAVREESVLPDLFALADFVVPPRAQRTRKFTAPPSIRRRPTELHEDYKHRRQHRTALTASVYLPQTSSRYSGLPGADCFEDLGHGFASDLLSFAPQMNGTARTTATPMPSRSIDERDDCACSHRDSNSSDSTAILSPPIPEHSTSAHKDASTLPGGIQAPRISYSPSQRTLQAADCNCDCAFDHPGYGCAENFSDMLALQSLDAHESCTFGRRPHSEGFSQHSHALGLDAGLSDGFVEHVALARNYRAMCIRTSCAESELVKTPFDLAKMLPNTPQ